MISVWHHLMKQMVKNKSFLSLSTLENSLSGFQLKLPETNLVKVLLKLTSYIDQFKNSSSWWLILFHFEHYGLNKKSKQFYIYLWFIRQRHSEKWICLWIFERKWALAEIDIECLFYYQQTFILFSFWLRVSNDFLY